MPNTNEGSCRRSHDTLEPDVKVANSAEVVITGRDEQLEAAVKTLLAEIDAAK